MKVVCGRASQSLGSKLARNLGVEILPAEYRTFPDNEQYLKLDREPSEDIVVVQSIVSDSGFVNLLFLLDALGNNEITAVVPYFGYARQDKKFKEGEPISARAIAQAIDGYIEKLITVDVHDKGISKYFDSADFRNLTAFKEISGQIPKKTNQLVVAPDEGAIEYAETLSSELNCSYDYFEKKRESEENVKTERKSLDVEGKQVIVADDIVSTGGTMANAIKVLKQQGASSIKVAVTHSVFADNSVQKIYSAGADEIISTDTIEKSISNVSVSETIAKEIRE